MVSSSKKSLDGSIEEDLIKKYNNLGKIMIYILLMFDGLHIIWFVIYMIITIKNFLEIK